MVGLRSRLKRENALLLKPGVARNISLMRWTIQQNFQCSLVFCLHACQQSQNKHIGVLLLFSIELGVTINSFLKLKRIC